MLGEPAARVLVQVEAAIQMAGRARELAPTGRAGVLPRARATRLRNALVRAGIARVEQLRPLAEGQLSVAPGLGPSYVALIQEMLADGRDRELQALLDETPPLLEAPVSPDALLRRERDVLLVRFPPGEPPLSRAQIAQTLGVSPTRVAQLESRALDRLGRFRRAARLGQPLSASARADLDQFRHIPDTPR